MRVIFYAEPISLQMSKQLKKVADKESEEARWVSVQEFLEFENSKPGIRGYELIDWAQYLEQGG